MVLLKRARKTHIYNNDQHMEGVPDRQIDYDELVLYFHSIFKGLKESNQTFVSDLEKSSLVVVRRKGNAKANKVAKAKDQTEDAAENDAFMVQNSIWDTGDTAKKAEQKLRHSIGELFTSHDGKKSIIDWHEPMRYHILSAGVGDLQSMDYRSFVVWMGEGPRNHKTSVRASTIRGMQYFIKHWDGKI